MEQGTDKELKYNKETLEKLSIWGQQSKKDYDNIKNKSSELGLDGHKAVLGFTLRTILGDDGNSFAYMHTVITDPELIKGNQQNTLERLKFETEIPELPESLRDALKKVMEVVSKSEWTDKESYLSSKSAWDKMRKELEEEVKSNKELKDATEYYDSVSESLYSQ